MDRIVTDTLPAYPLSPVSFFLRSGSFDLLETYPPMRVDLTTDSNGGYAQALWINTDGLVPAHWLAVYPGKETIAFDLIDGEGPITMAELRAQEDWAWTTPPTPTAIELERARYADTGSVGLGDALNGVRNAGAGATARTVHDKFGDLFLTTDYDTFAAAVIAAAGKTLVVNSSVSVPTSMTVPSTVALRFERGGLLTVASGQTLTINGPLDAGRHQIFAGAGSVLGDPRCAGAYPEWFGAAADVDSTAAFQKAVNLHLVVIGDRVTQYRIQTDLNLWTPKNLHRIKHSHSTPSRGWSNGIWYGVRLRDGSIVRACRILATRISNPNGTGDPLVKTGKGTFVFAVGNPLYADPEASPENQALRVERVTVTDNEFRHFDFLVDGVPYLPGERYKCLVAQSCNDVRFTDNDIISHYVRNNYVGVFAFDCTNMDLSRNYGERVFSGFTLEYCSNILIANNRLWNSRQLYDLDARDENVVVEFNIMDRETRDTATDDAAHEANGVINMVVHGNITRNAHRGFVNGCKLDLYEDWAGVMGQSGPVSTGLWQNVHLYDNLWTEITWQGILSGSNWNTRPHTGELVGSGFTCYDTFENVGYALGSSEKHAIWQMYEGRGLEIHPKISNPAAFLTTVATAVIDIDPAVYSLHLTSVTGMEVGQKLSVQYNAHEDAPRHHLVATITVIDSGTSIITLDAPLTWTIDAGNSVHYGPGGASGIYAVSFLEGEGVAAAEDTLAIAGAVDDDTITLVSVTGFEKRSGIVFPVLMDDGDLVDFESVIENIIGNVLYLSEPLPGTAEIGTVVSQAATIGAGASSALEIDSLGGRIEDTAFAGIVISNPGRVHFDRPIVRNTGRHDLPGSRRQVWIEGLDGNYGRPVPGDPAETPVAANIPAVITGSLDIQATIDDIRFGLLLHAGDFTPGMFSVILPDCRIRGHNSVSDGALDTYDFVMIDSVAQLEDMTNVFISGDIPTSAINLNVASPMSFRKRLEMFSPSPPISAGGRNHGHAVDTIVWNTAPGLGAPLGWVCVTAGTPGIWMPFGRPSFSGSKSWDKPQLANGSRDSTNVIVEGAIAGRPARAGVTGLAGIWRINARVETDGFVQVIVENLTGATVAASTVVVTAEAL